VHPYDALDGAPELWRLERETRTSMVTALWDKHAVLCCLAIGISMDANRDGIGDFQGLMRRRDALHGLTSPLCG